MSEVLTCLRKAQRCQNAVALTIPAGIAECQAMPMRNSRPALLRELILWVFILFFLIYIFLTHLYYFQFSLGCLDLRVECSNWRFQWSLVCPEITKNTNWSNKFLEIETFLTLLKMKKIIQPEVLIDIFWCTMKSKIYNDKIESTPFSVISFFLWYFLSLQNSSLVSTLLITVINYKWKLTQRTAIFALYTDIDEQLFKRKRALNSPILIRRRFNKYWN